MTAGEGDHLGDRKGFWASFLSGLTITTVVTFPQYCAVKLLATYADQTSR